MTSSALVLNYRIEKTEAAHPSTSRCPALRISFLVLVPGLLERRTQRSPVRLIHPVELRISPSHNSPRSILLETTPYPGRTSPWRDLKHPVERRRRQVTEYAPAYHELHQLVLAREKIPTFPTIDRSSDVTNHIRALYLVLVSC